MPFGRLSASPTFTALALAVVMAGCQDPHRSGAPSQAHSPAAVAQGAKPELVTAGAGPVDTVVKTALADAQRDKKRLLVYVSATWCHPCEEFQAALRGGSLDAYFPGVRFLKFDQDRDNERLAMAGYDGQWIPRFVLPAADGKASPRRVEGAAKSADTVGQSIGPRLQELLGMRVAAAGSNP